jgi:formylglycine-generating enzyme required for sulfatase activity
MLLLGCGSEPLQQGPPDAISLEPDDTAGGAGDVPVTPPDQDSALPPDAVAPDDGGAPARDAGLPDDAQPDVRPGADTEGDSGGGSNACGGEATLVAAPGTGCGACGGGTWVCEGTDAVVCDGGIARNACGGCTTLRSEPGGGCILNPGEEPEIEGRLVCTPEGGLRCADVRANACGGDGVLRWEDDAAEPGEACGVGCSGGVLACEDEDTLGCQVDPSDVLSPNACGGCARLAGQPDEPCGNCGGGLWTCDGTDAVTCEGARPTDACGGCGDMSAVVGQPCAAGRIWACDATALRCVEPPPEPVTCATLRCEDRNRSCIDFIVVACGSCLTGFFDDGAGNCVAAPPPPTGVTATQGTRTTDVEVRWQAVAGATGYHVWREGTRITSTPITELVFRDTGAPGGQVLPAPMNVAASRNRPLDVEITWTAVEGTRGGDRSYTVSTVRGSGQSAQSAPATGWRGALTVVRYEVEVGGAWFNGSLNTFYRDTGPASGTVRLTGRTASVDLEDRVRLSATAAVDPGPERTYRVRTRWEGGVSAASGPVTGQRLPGTLTWQWQSANQSTGPWTNLPGGTTATFEDTTVPAGGSRWYRVRVDAEGAGFGISTPVEGRLLPSGPRPGGPCSEDLDCPARFQCPTDVAASLRRCAPRLVIGPQDVDFVYVPAGSFTMGSPEAELGRDAVRETQVEVTISRPFFMQQTEVTQGQWSYLAARNPSSNSACGSLCPVENITWWSALWYANAVSEELALQPCYLLPTSGCTGTGPAGTLSCGNGSTFVGLRAPTVQECTGYRLPTEAEWEWAARAGTTTATWAGDLQDPVGTCSNLQPQPILDPIAWWCGNSLLDGTRRIRPVATRAPNPWGLYDMPGNVVEITWDRFASALPGGLDPTQTTGVDFTGRGGSFLSFAGAQRSAQRWQYASSSRAEWRGLRLVRTLR